MKSGPRLQGRLCRQAKAELRPQGPFPQINTLGKRGGAANILGGYCLGFGLGRSRRGPVKNILPDLRGACQLNRLKLHGARRKTRGRMIWVRRGNAVLAHSCANLKEHFVRNGCKRVLRAVRGKGSFRPGKRLQEPPAPVVWGRKTGELSVAWLLEGPWPG